MRTLSHETEERILDGTLALLGDREFAAITTREISSRAGISESTLFRYFRHKDEILEALVRDRSREFFQELEQIRALMKSPADQLLLLGRYQARYVLRNRDFIRVLQREATYIRPASSGFFEGLQKYLCTLAEVFREGIAQGQFRDDLDVDGAAMSFHGIVSAVLLQDAAYPGRLTSEDSFLRAAESLLQILFHGIRRAS